MRPYEGLLTAMVTPFHADGRVNEDAAVAIARHLLANGSHGLVVAGTTGEAATLTDDEQVALVELIAGEAGGDGAIVAGAGSNDTRHAVAADRARHRRRRRGGPLRHALLQQAEPARDRAPLRGGRARGRGHAGGPLQHPRPHRGQHGARPARRAGPDRRRSSASSRPTPPSCSRSTGSRSSPATTTSTAPASTWAAPAGSASPRTSSGPRCAACTTSRTRARRSTRRCATSTRRCSSPPARRRSRRR